MNDNELFELVRGIILAALPARGLTGWRVARKYQPAQQGANTAPTVYLFKVLDKRIGSPYRKYDWDETGQRIELGEFQQYESTFQASALVTETTDPTALTPSDALNVVAAIMQADEALAALQAAEAGILRICEVRNPYNTNDANRFQAEPSLDFVLTYKRSFQGTTPFAVTVDSVIDRV